MDTLSHIADCLALVGTGSVPEAGPVGSSDATKATPAQAASNDSTNRTNDANSNSVSSNAAPDANTSTAAAAAAAAGSEWTVPTEDTALPGDAALEFDRTRLKQVWFRACSVPMCLRLCLHVCVCMCVALVLSLSLSGVSLFARECVHV